MKLLICAMLVVLCQSVMGSDVEFYLEHARRSHLALIAKKKADLEVCRAQKKAGFNSASHRRNVIRWTKELEKEILELESSSRLEMPKEIHLDEVGEIGIFNAHLNMIQVLGPETALMFTSGYRETVMIKGKSTRGMVDGDVYEFMDVFHVTGTTTYRTAAGGTNTVLVMELLDLTGLEEHLASAPQTVSSRKPARIIRTWRDATGRFSVEAAFKSYGARGVTLSKLDESQITVPMSRLSEPDQRYVRSLLKRRLE